MHHARYLSVPALATGLFDSVRERDCQRADRELCFVHADLGSDVPAERPDVGPGRPTDQRAHRGRRVHRRKRPDLRGSANGSTNRGCSSDRRLDLSRDAGRGPNPSARSHAWQPDP